MIGLTYKNYKNSKLSTYASNLGFNLLLDNFVLRPILSILLAFPLSKSDTINNHISTIER